MKYAIKLTACDHSGISAERRLSTALGFSNEMSKATLIDIFAGGVYGGEVAHKNGVFDRKKSAQVVADAIEARCAFGGTPVAITAKIVEV